MGAAIEDASVVQFLLKNLKRQKEGGYRWKANIDAIEKNYSSIIENSLSPMYSYEEPTLFIKGGASPRYIEESAWPAVLDYFPDARLEVIEKAGHWVHAENPGRIIDLIKQFVI